MSQTHFTCLQRYIDGMAVAGLHVTGTVGTISPRDRLIVIDMQNDFMPGGSFGVDEGDLAVPPTVALIRRFKAAASATSDGDGGAVVAGPPLVIASRDYHPADHCSFSVFPPHCVQGTKGSFFHEAVGTALHDLGPASATVVFKGYSNGIDSFGAFPYPAAVADSGRITRACPDATGCDGGAPIVGGGANDRVASAATVSVAPCPCSLQWTGGTALTCSNAAADVNAPPDVMAVLSRVPLADVIGAADSVGTLFLCGLALDFCVLDSALNARAAGYRNVVIVVDATRATVASSAADVAAQLIAAEVRIVLSE